MTSPLPSPPLQVDHLPTTLYTQCVISHQVGQRLLRPRVCSGNPGEISTRLDAELEQTGMRYFSSEGEAGQIYPQPFRADNNSFFGGAAAYEVGH